MCLLWVMNQSAGRPEGDVGVPVKGMGVAPIFPLPNVGHYPSSGDFPHVSVGTITLLHPPKPLSNHVLINDAFNQAVLSR